jgi:excisionase family DNA binding protein
MNNGRERKALGGHDRRLPLCDRLSLRPAEAAAALGVSERTFRQLLPQLPHVREGNVVLVPVDSLRAWLGQRARAQASATDDAVAEILAAVASDD